MKRIISLIILSSALIICNSKLLADGDSYQGRAATNSKDFNSENLFTGDVAFSVPITTIGSVNVALNYNSNIHKFVRADNAMQQAGWVGLGWSLNFGSIVGDINGTKDTSDDTYYYVTSSGSSKLVPILGNSFMLKEYQYWKITRVTDAIGNITGWMIVTDNGTTMRLGNYDKSSGNFIFDTTFTKATHFMLGWDGLITNAVSSQYANAQMISCQWDLSDIEDIAHNHTTINYFQELDCLSVPTSGGSTNTAKDFTRASYPQSIVNYNGRSVTFILGNLSAAEYPQKAGYDGLNKSIQAFYLSYYLNSVIVKDNNGNTVQTFNLDYQTADVLNLGYTKRYLTSITNVDKLGNTQPPTSFFYYGVGSSSNSGAFIYSGALRTITYPNGGQVTYQYKAQAVTNVSLDSNRAYSRYNYPLDINNETMTNYPYFGLSGTDFYATQLNDNTFKVFVWDTKGWHEDTSFPVTGGINCLWVMNDYIVINQPNLATGNDELKVVKRKQAGWEAPYLVASEPAFIDGYGNTSHQLKVVGRGNDYFVVGKNFQWNNPNYNENSLAVTWISGAWKTQQLGIFGLGNSGASLNADCGQRYFLIQSASPGANSYDSCALMMFTGQQWVRQYSWKPGIGYGCNDLIAAKDYFLVTYYNNGVPCVEVRKWPFVSLSDYQSINWFCFNSVNGPYSTVYYPEIEVADEYFVLYGSIASGPNKGKANQVYVFTNSGNATNNNWFDCTDASSVFNASGSAFPQCFMSLGPNQLALCWGNGTQTLAVSKLMNGTWQPAQVVDTYANYDNTYDQGQYYSFNNLFVDVVQDNPRTYRRLMYYPNGSSWGCTQLVNQLIDEWRTPQNYNYRNFLSMPGSNFSTEILDSTITYCGGIPHSLVHKAGFDLNMLPVYNGNPYDYPIASKTVTDGMGSSYVTTYAFSNGTFDENMDYAKYNKVTVYSPPNSPNDTGKTVTYFYNDLGLSQCEQFVSVPNYTQMDGIPYMTIAYDASNNIVSQTTSTWSAYAIDANHDVYHKRLLQTNATVDGVTTATSYTYNNSNGQVSKIIEPVQANSNLGGLRDRETDITYAFQQYPSMQTANMLTQAYEKKVSAICNPSMTSITATAVYVTFDAGSTSNHQSFTIHCTQTVTVSSAFSNGGTSLADGSVSIGTINGGQDVWCHGYASNGTSSYSFAAVAGQTYYLTAFVEYDGEATKKTQLSAAITVTYDSQYGPENALLSWQRTEYDGSNFPVRNFLYNGTSFILTDNIIIRDVYGNVTENANIDNVHSATKYEGNGTRIRASIVNATDAETRVENCEEFVNTSYGNLATCLTTYNNGNAALTYSTSTDAVSGTSQQVQITGLTSNSAGVNIPMGALNASKNYVIEFDYKVTQGALEALTYTDGTNYQSQCTFNAQNQWCHAYFIWSLGGNGNNSSLWLRAPWNGVGATNTTFLLDNIRIYPANAQCVSQTYDPSTLQVVGTTDMNGVTTHYRYDGFGRCTEVLK